MSDLLARLAQRPPAPPPGLTGPYLEYAERKCVEFDRDLALDALADACDELDAHGTDPKFVGPLRTILRELRGATSGEGGSHD